MLQIRRTLATEVGHVIEQPMVLPTSKGLRSTMANELLRFEDGTRWADRQTSTGVRLVPSSSVTSVALTARPSHRASPLRSRW